jgi:phosphatidylinositol alpha-mannosyltransferase
MRILQVVPFYPPHVGGVESHVFELVGRLRKLGHTVYVLTANQPPLNNPANSCYEKRLPLFLKMSGKWGEIPICPSIFSALAEMRPDVVHIHTPPRFFAECTAFFYRFMASNRIPIIVTYHLHNSSLKRLEKSIWWLHNRTLQRFVFNTANKLILCNSQESEAFMQEFGVQRTKFAIIPPGVDCDKFDPRKVTGNLLQQKGIVGNKIILFSGRLNQVKGLNFLIQAFGTVLKRFENSTLVICGAETGNYKYDLEKLAKNLNLSSNVVFLDPVPALSYPSLLASCDVFVLPSLSESWPISLAEALSMEKPAVATDVGGVKEIVHDNETGLIVKPGDVIALSNAIVQLLEDKNLSKQLGKTGRKFIVDNFDWARLTNKFEDLYKESVEKAKCQFSFKEVYAECAS